MSATPRRAETCEPPRATCAMPAGVCMRRLRHIPPLLLGVRCAARRPGSINLTIDPNRSNRSPGSPASQSLAKHGRWMAVRGAIADVAPFCRVTSRARAPTAARMRAGSPCHPLPSAIRVGGGAPTSVPLGERDAACSPCSTLPTRLRRAASAERAIAAYILCIEMIVTRVRVL